MKALEILQVALQIGFLFLVGRFIVALIQIAILKLTK